MGSSPACAHSTRPVYRSVLLLLERYTQRIQKAAWRISEADLSCSSRQHVSISDNGFHPPPRQQQWLCHGRLSPGPFSLPSEGEPRSPALPPGDRHLPSYGMPARSLDAEQSPDCLTLPCQCRSAVLQGQRGAFPPPPPPPPQPPPTHPHTHTQIKGKIQTDCSHKEWRDGTARFSKLS